MDIGTRLLLREGNAQPKASGWWSSSERRNQEKGCPPSLRRSVSGHMRSVRAGRNWAVLPEHGSVLSHGSVLQLLSS